MYTDHMTDALENKVDALTGMVQALSTSMEKNLAAIAADIDDLNEKVENNHLELRSKLAGIEHRLDEEANTRQDQKIPTRIADLEIETFGGSRASQTAA